MKTLISASCLFLFATGAAFAQAPAQTNPSTNPNQSVTSPQTNNEQNGNQSQADIQAQLRTNLAKSGFTDIQMMPAAFLVRAKDQAGNPVMMIINPDSLTEVTALGNGNQNQQQSNPAQSQSGPASQPAAH